MKSIINILKMAIKYGAVVMAIVKVVEFAVEQFENIDLKKSNLKKL